jgi:hypothetical protein
VEVVNLVVDPTLERPRGTKDVSSDDTPAAGAGLLDQLNQLGDLHASGIFADEEFLVGESFKCAPPRPSASMPCGR